MYFPNLGSALGALLARALPMFGQPEHGSSWAHVYVVGELPEEELGTARLGQGTRAVSPLAAMRQVRVLREEDGTGRWLPVHLLRPFVPPDMPADAAQRRIDEALREGRHHSEQLPREQRRKRPRPSDVVRAPRGGGPFVCKRGDPTKRRKVNTKAGMVFFVDRLGAMPHAIERVEREGPPGADYKVLCMRPILAETEEQDVRVPEGEAARIPERSLPRALAPLCRLVAAPPSAPASSARALTTRAGARTRRTPVSPRRSRGRWFRTHGSATS